MNLYSLISLIFFERLPLDEGVSPKELSYHYRVELGKDCHLDKVFVAMNYNKIEQKLERYKYASDREYAEDFSKMLSLLFKQYHIKDESISPIVVPVPMHWSRYFLRGFDHVARFTRIFATRENLTYLPLLRARWSERQSKLSRAKRLENKKNRFRMSVHKNIKGKTIILVDDVISTGSTANECARLLKKSGARTIIGLFLSSNAL